MEAVPSTAGVDPSLALGSRGPNHQIRPLLSMTLVTLMLNYIETIIIPEVPKVRSAEWVSAIR